MRRRAVLGCLLAPILPLPAVAQRDGPVSEPQVKAAYLHRFLDFVEWPVSAFASAGSPYAIGVAGADALADELEALVASRRPHGRPVVVKRLRPGDDADGLHVLFIGRAATGRAGSLLAATSGKPVLTVTETDEAFAAGSAICFVTVDKRVRFDVALRPAEEHGLKISSRLLGVARNVTGTHS